MATVAAEPRIGGTKLVANLSSAVADLQASVPRGLASVVTFEPRRIVRAISDDGTGTIVYKIVSLPQVAFVPSGPSAYPSRKQRKTVFGLAALRSFFAKTEAWEQLTDAELFEQALAVAEEYRLDGNACRRLGTLCSLAALARKGCPDIRPDQLP